MEDERKHIIIAHDASGRISPETLAKLAEINAKIMVDDISHHLQVYVGEPHTKKTQEEIIKDLNDYVKYPSELYQNREARRKAFKEAKRKGRHMF